MKQFRRAMAKLSSIQKNLNRLNLIEKFSVKRKSLKEKIMNKDLSIEERLQIQNKLNDLPRNSSSIRFRNRCKLTGRTRGVYRKFGLSRIKIRELSMSGDLPGVVKSSFRVVPDTLALYPVPFNSRVLENPMLTPVTILDIKDLIVPHLGFNLSFSDLGLINISVS
jgi:small subunit ribosomal protein S14